MPFAQIPSKSQAPIAFEIYKSSDNDDGPLVVFINGLGLPAASWKATVSQVQAWTDSPIPWMMTYDRYGQGDTTSRDPTDKQPGKEPGYGHDLTDVVRDLHELLQVVTPQKSSRLVLVAASIGAHIARLYAHERLESIDGIIILDSNIGNMEFTDMWPDPTAPDFDPKEVISEDCTLEEYTAAYSLLGERFNSYIKNPEGLDRRNVKKLLPESSAPRLIGSEGKGPRLTIVGHDPVQFAEESFKTMNTPRSITRKYTQPAWQHYNEGLLELSEPDRRTGVLFAPGCGHFIQRDNPEFVANQLKDLLQKICDDQ